MSENAKSTQVNVVCPHCLAQNGRIAIKAMQGQIPLPPNPTLRGTAQAVPCSTLITVCGECNRPWAVQHMVMQEQSRIEL